jgi:hypothetical protein
VNATVLHALGTHLLPFYRAAACSSHSLMRPRIAAALVARSVVITALSVSRFSARSESWAAYTLRITDHAWVVSSGLRKPRDGGLNGRFRHLQSKQAQAFAAPHAMPAHAQRRAAPRFADPLSGSIHIVTVTPFRGPKWLLAQVKGDTKGYI